MSEGEGQGGEAPAGGAPGPRRAPIVSFPLKVLTVATSLLVLGLGIGYLLPGTWEVERSASLPAPPEAVFPWLDDPRAWGDWAPLGDVEARFTGPDRGPGATRRWDDPQVGNGAFTIVSTVPGRSVSYRVQVQEGRLVTEGTLQLEAAGSGTHLVWRERGDFGHNPLLGYVALTMDRTQGAQMEAALARLRERVAAAP